jgi:hypothetical protein
MYISHVSMPEKAKIGITYDEDYDKYILTLGTFYLRVTFNQDEIEELYNEILGAMMHKRFAGEEVAVEVDLQD